MFTRARPRAYVFTLYRPPIPRGARRFTSQSASYSSSAGQTPSSFGPLGGLIQELDKISPRFEIEPGRIEIIRDPSDFYAVLKAKILKAQKRIYLSTLYFGKAEHELIDTLREALKTNPQLRLSILTDALRGTRESPKQSCASLIAPLIAEFGGDRVEICMFHTPNLTGLRKAVIPKRVNEGWGLQHMKLYGIDDELILSGANLSEDYFTDRQDRYHLFKDRRITEYFEKVHSSICSLSFQIKPSEEEQGYSMEWPANRSCPSPIQDPTAFRKHSTSVLSTLIKPAVKQETTTASTIVYPIAQFTPLLKPDTSTELPALEAVLKAISKPPLADSSWTFTAGYFNMTPAVRRLLLATQPRRGTIIAASPWANGFYGSAGVSGMLPDAYTLLSKRFVDAVRWRGLDTQITLKEWRRGTIGEPNGWTYHAKGIWVTLPNEQAPSMTVVGSSNYTKRSYSLDLEANVLLITRDEKLQRQLGEEERWLQEYAKPMSSSDYDAPERAVGIKVRIAMWLVKILGGAL